MADVESEEDEALLETKSESDGSVDRPDGNYDDEGDHECSCKGCDMPSETWVGDESRCAQCTGESCGCECEGCSRKRMVRTCKCRDCEEQPAVGMAYCHRCSQLQISDGKLLRGCRCECKGCELKQSVAIAQQEHPAAGEIESATDQAISTMGEAQHQMSRVSENASSNWSQVSESGDCSQMDDGIKAEVFGMVVKWAVQDNLIRKFWFGTRRNGRWDKSPRVSSFDTAVGTVQDLRRRLAAAVKEPECTSPRLTSPLKPQRFGAEDEGSG